MTPIQQQLDAFLRQMVDFKKHCGGGERFMSPEEYTLANGRWYESSPLTLDEETTLHRALKLYGGRLPIKQCFYNSQMLLIAAESIVRFEYVEGYVVREPIPFPIVHAWLTLNGKVIDTTLRAAEGTPAPRPKKTLRDRVAVGQFHGDMAYFGSTFTAEQIRQRIIGSGGVSGSMLEDYERGFPFLRREAAA